MQNPLEIRKGRVEGRTGGGSNSLLAKYAYKSRGRGANRGWLNILFLLGKAQRR